MKIWHINLVIKVLEKVTTGTHSL